jgi:hypothetical protein
MSEVMTKVREDRGLNKESLNVEYLNKLSVTGTVTSMSRVVKEVHDKELPTRLLLFLFDQCS